MPNAAKVFVDTNVLMEYSTEILNTYDKILICGYVLEELDRHKMSSDENKKFQARRAIRDIESNENKIEYIIKEGSYSLPIYFNPSENDNKIISLLMDLHIIDDNIVAISNDLLFRQKCKLLNIPCEKFEYISDFDDNYTGYKEVTLTDEEQAEHYQNPINRWDLLDNQFLIIKNCDGEIIDKQRWTDSKGFCPINSKPFKSIYFPDFKPRDVYQMLAMDSLNKDSFTLLFGKAGTAKTLCSLSWIMQNLHNNKIDKCVVIFNPVKLRNNEQLGFYSGNRTEKLLQNSIGGILASKLGDITLVESLINNGKLMIVPTSDIRGIEISDNDCLYVTEAQNTDAYTMRTIIQRAKEGCKIIIEGDMLEQQDIKNCRENGMMRVINVFKGTKYFSCVKLKNIYRSPIADLAQNI